MKIPSRCREQAKWVYDGAVFEIKKEIPDQRVKNVRLEPLVLIAASLAGGSLSATPQGGSKNDSSSPTVRVGGDIEPPVQVKNIPPLYPPGAQRARVEGIVIIEATIGTDGKVKDAKVIRSVKMLDDSAVRAVREWEYKPTVINGQAVQVVTAISINFTLE